MSVSAKTLDFSNVKESTGINPKHIEDGEYLAKVVSVVEQDAKDGTPMWLFLITPNDHRSATYPYYCKLSENQLWKVRNLFISAGLGSLVAGKSKVKINPNKVVGKTIGIVLEEDEYEGKMKSVIEAVMPASDLEDGGVAEDPDVDVDDDEDEEEVVEAPKKKRKAAAPVVEEEDEEEDEEEEVVAPPKRKKKAKAPVVVEEEEDDEEEEEEEVAPPKKRKAKAKPAPVEEDDEDEEEEEEAPVSKRTAARRAAKALAEKKSKKAPAADEDDEDDDLDLDDL